MINSKLIVSSSFSVKNALTHFNNSTDHLLFIVDENNFLLGTLTDGDIRRGIIKGLRIENNIIDFLNPSFKSVLNKADLKTEKVKSLLNDGIVIIPVLDSKGRIIELINLSKLKAIVPVTAIIMAGGRGIRLMPLTKDRPKPMLEIDGRPIIEHVVDRLISFGVSDIYISVRYLSDQIKEYFGNGDSKNINIKYIDEDEPLGTMGAISVLKNNKKLQDNLLVLNSDLLTNIDFESMFNKHVLNKSDYTIASIPYRIDIPYAIMETKNSEITDILEKPTYNYHVNAGIYLFKTELIKELKDNSYMDAPDFAKKIIEMPNKKLTFYQILGYWKDIGKHEDLIEARENFVNIKF